MELRRVLSNFLVVSLIFLMVLSAISIIIPTAGAAGSITLSNSQVAAGGSLIITGAGFPANTNIAIGFGQPVQVSGEVVNNRIVDGTSRTYILAYHPIEPGTFVQHVVGVVTGTTEDDKDNGAGEIRRVLDDAFAATIDYTIGRYYRTGITSNPNDYILTVSYNRYPYDVTPTSNITTSANGAFSAIITVPSVSIGTYAVTAIAATGNRAVSSLSVGASQGWSKTYGGIGNDIGTGDTEQTNDGGYAILGDTNSSGAGGTDFWLFKTDANGNMQWNKTYGGTLDETCADMYMSNDGGFALSGNTRSFGVQGTDVFFVKTDAAGNLQWNKTYGGPGNESMLNVIQTSDRGYILSGYTSSIGAGANDAWLIKTDANGNMQWNKTYGGNSAEMGYDLVQTSDGGYTFAGYTGSFGAGGNDAWLVNTDANGNMIWNKTYGGSSADQAFGLVQTSDGGYAMAGYTIRGGLMYAYLVRTDANGNMLWEKTYRETNSTQIGLHMVKTADEGFAIIGSNYLNAQDFLLIKTDAAGNLMWNMTYGGSGLDNGYALLQTGDGGYVLTGTTASSGAGGNDIWLVKVNEAGVVPEGLTLGFIMVLSTIAALMGTMYLRKQPRISKGS